MMGIYVISITTETPKLLRVTLKKKKKEKVKFTITYVEYSLMVKKDKRNM